MAPTTLVYDFDEINQSETFTLANGVTLTIATTDYYRLLHAVRQLEDRRRDYLKAWQCGCDADTDVRCDFHADWHPHVDDDALLYTPLRKALHAALEATPQVQRHRRNRAARQAHLDQLWQDKVWHAADGRVIDIATIDPTYATNILRFLEEREDTLGHMRVMEAIGVPNGGESRTRAQCTDGWVTRTPVYRALQARVQEAGLVDRVAGKVRQTGRKAHHRVTGRWPAPAAARD